MIKNKKLAKISEIFDNKKKSNRNKYYLGNMNKH